MVGEGWTDVAAEAAASYMALEWKERTRVDVYSGDLQRVAEILMVLSAMGQMRGGHDPTAAERSLLAEAREKLANMCQSVDHRKDLFTWEMAMGVVEDLGLNPPEDHLLRPPKMSIAEKVANTKRKMEESKEFAVQSSTHSSQLLPVSFGAKPGSCSPLFHGAHRILPDKSSSMPLSASSFQTASLGVHVPALASPTSSLNLSQVNGTKGALSPMKSSSSTVERDPSSFTLPHMETSHFRLDAQPNEPSYISQVQASSSGDHLSEKSSPSVQSTPATVVKSGQANNLNHTSVKVEGIHGINVFQTSPQVLRDQDSNSSVIQPAAGNLHLAHQPSPGVTFMHAPSLFTNHNGISKIVERILQLKAFDQPNWTPPSTNYMNKSLSCQMCKIIISDLESLLVCDACEKGVHLKCIMSYNQRGIPKGEWHCPTCLLSSNGKPFPPKYGQVTRNIAASRASSNTCVQASTEKKVDNLDSKANHQKMILSGSPGIPNPSLASTVGINHVELTTGIKMPNISEVQGVDFPVANIKEENGAHKRTSTDHSDGGAGPTCVSSGAPNGSSNQHTLNSGLLPCGMQRLTSASQPKVESEHCNSTQASGFSGESNPPCQSPSNSKFVNVTEVTTSCKIPTDPLHEIGKHTTEQLKTLSELRKMSGHEADCYIRKDVVNSQVTSDETSDSGDGSKERSMPSSTDLHNVEWVGGSTHQAVDGKSYYQSCCINGVVYKLLDDVLISSDNYSIFPSKLQVLWEDDKSRTKWAIVNRCYFPNDLTEIVLRPSTTENNEMVL